MLDINKLKEVLHDAEFIQSLTKIENVTQAQKMFAEKGVEMTVEELLSLKAEAKKAAGADLSDSDLAFVTGGTETAAQFQSINPDEYDTMSIVKEFYGVS